MALDDYVTAGAFQITAAAADDVMANLRALQAQGDIAGLLRVAVRQRRNILVSGGTATGKTTFLNTLLREVPVEERLILIEDTPELDIPHPNQIGLLAGRSALSEASIGAEDLLNASLRMRPDRIILGELRGPEAFTFLRAVNTGHPGSMTSVHADSPERAIEQIALLVLQTGTRLSYQDIVTYVRSTIDLYVQVDRRGGHRFVSAVDLKGGRQ